MQLLTKQNEKNLPPLYSQENNTNPVIKVKFFDPTGSWTWYAYEGSWVSEDGMMDDDKPKTSDYLFFGLVDGFEAEIGYFSLKELQSLKGRLNLGIKRDLYFTPTPLKEIQAEIDARRG